jgi:hypothetical protein
MYPGSQLILGQFIVADHNGCPFCPVRVDQPGGEPLFRELIHKQANWLLDIRKVFPGDLTSRVVLT